MTGGARIASLRAATAPDAALPKGRGLVAGRVGRADRWALLGLGLLFVAFTALTWKTWGNPQTDYGVELTTADRLAHGAVLYSDIRYFYGPLGVYPLALFFKVFGTSFTTAFAFGLAQALAIFATFYALARTWLTPLLTGIATAIVMAIGFTGTLFGYVAPHTTSATFGLLAVLLQLLALSRGRLGLAGVAAGAAALTRPEMLVVAFAICGGYALGRALESGWRRAARDLVPLLGPALLIPLAVFAPFAIAAGPGDLVFNQLIPLDFTRTAGLNFSANWAPFTATSAIALAVRGLVYASLLAALAAASWRWSKRPGIGALAPLAIAAGGLLALDAAAHLSGAFPGTRGVIQTEAQYLLLGMSWLPVAALAVLAWAALRARQRRPAPISGSWALDLALIAGALVFAGRAYNEFTTNTYAGYYAPLLVLLAAILHERLGARYPAARAGILTALVAVFAGLSWNVLTGPASEDDYVQRTARGSYLAPGYVGPAYQRTLDLVRARTKAGEPVLAMPLEGGLPFAVDRPPALRDQQFHPGILDSATDEREALATLRRHRVPLVVLGNARFDAWGYPVIGVDYNRMLIAGIKRRYPRVTEVGDFADAPVGRVEGRAYRIYQRP